MYLLSSTFRLLQKIFNLLTLTSERITKTWENNLNFFVIKSHFELLDLRYILHYIQIFENHEHPYFYSLLLFLPSCHLNFKPLITFLHISLFCCCSSSTKLYLLLFSCSVKHFGLWKVLCKWGWVQLAYTYIWKRSDCRVFRAHTTWVQSSAWLDSRLQMSFLH